MMKLLACHQHYPAMPHYRLRLKLTHGALPKAEDELGL